MAALIATVSIVKFVINLLFAKTFLFVVVIDEKQTINCSFSERNSRE